MNPESHSNKNEIHKVSSNLKCEMVDSESGCDCVMVPVLQSVGQKLDRMIIFGLILQSLEARSHELVSKMPSDLQVRGGGATLKCDLRKVISLKNYD